MKKILSFSFGLLFPLLSCFAHAADAEATAIEALLERIEEVFAAGDIEGAMTAFTEDAVILQNDGPDITGHGEIRAAYTGLMEQFKVGVSFTTTGIDVSGDMAVEQGTYVLSLTPKSGGAATDATYRHIHVLKKQSDGSWKTWRMMTNSLGPAPTP